MYNIYDENSGKTPSYYTIRRLYNRSFNKRLNLQFQIYDDLENNYFSEETRGNKSIIYDLTHIVLEEFQLQNLSDKQLWSTIIITWKILKKKYNNTIDGILSEIFKEIEKYLKKEKIHYGRLGKYDRFGDSQSEIWQIYSH